jgi:Mg-chelatase subunit ChlD
MNTGITIGDIKKALLSGGDVSSFIPALHQALADPPVTSIASLELPIALPEATALLGHIDNDLASLLNEWAQGRGYSQSLVQETELTLVGLAPYGRNISSYLESIIDEAAPDIFVIDTSTLGLSINMLYAFSMPCAVGLPIYGEISTKDGEQFYTDETFYPGNAIQTAIVRCWLAKIPLIPVGMPSVSMRSTASGKANKTSLGKEMQQSSLLAAYQALDESLGNMPNLQKGIKITQDICSNLSKARGSHISRAQVEEASYIASRIMEAASFVHSLGRKAKLLAVVDIRHYSDTQYFIDLLTKGLTGEIYLPPIPHGPMTTLTMVSRYSVELNEHVQQHAPKTTLIQKLFRQELEKLSAAKGNEQVPESEIDALIAAIVSRTREHPDVARGASVRGAIALKEVLHGFEEIQGKLMRSSIEKAALVTLPPRMSTKQADYKSAVNIVSDILKEVLYGIRFSKVKTETIPPGQMRQLSPDDIMKALQNLDNAQLSQEQKEQLTQKERSVIPARYNQQELSEYTTSDDFRQNEMEKRYPFTKNAIQHLFEELEQKLRRGEITENEYLREKANLEEILNAASQLESQMSDKELAETVIELMDAKDKQWGKEVNPEQMFVYYHIKGTREEKQLNTAKQSWHGLRVVLDYLEKQGILRAATSRESFALTAKAMDTLLEQVTMKGRRGRELKGVTDGVKAQASERGHDIKRYCLGDVFRDISVRHTLREIARQKKKLSDIDRRDFKVFLKQPRRLQSDIILCVDSSGSMGFHQKLIHARLVAAGLVRTAVENGDRVGLVTFDDFSRTTMPLTDKSEELFNYIATINAGGNTNIGDGIRCATQLLLRKPSRNRKYIVLITDGQPTAISQEAFRKFEPAKEKDLTEEYATLETRRASSCGIKTSVIHITEGKKLGEGFAKNIAKVGGGQVRSISCLDYFKTAPLQGTNS